MMGGSLSMGVTSQTSQMLWAFRAGRLLGASPRAQVVAQIAGMLVGAIVTVPVYAVIVSTYGLGTEKMPATSALSWKATAEMLHGLNALPSATARTALRWSAIGAGILLTLLAARTAPRSAASCLRAGGDAASAFMLPFLSALAACRGPLPWVRARSAPRRTRQLPRS